MRKRNGSIFSCWSELGEGEAEHPRMRGFPLHPLLLDSHTRTLVFCSPLA